MEFREGRKKKRTKVNFEIEGIHEEDLDLRRKKKPCQTILYIRIVCDSSILLSSGTKHLSHSGLTCQRQQLKGRTFCSCSFVLTWLFPYIFWALLCIIIFDAFRVLCGPEFLTSFDNSFCKYSFQSESRLWSAPCLLLFSWPQHRFLNSLNDVLD